MTHVVNGCKKRICIYALTDNNGSIFFLQSLQWSRAERTQCKLGVGLKVVPSVDSLLDLLDYSCDVDPPGKVL